MMLPLLHGVRAALAVPLWLREARLRDLLASQGGPGRAVQPDRAETAVLHSRRALALLARLPRSPWRNTCLFRSVAECLVLRRYGVAAHVQIGVRHDPGSADGVAAHAWVVVGAASARDPSADQFQPLHHAPSQ
jgi:hypothetical protein